MTHTQTVMLRLLTMCIPFRNLRKKWRTFLRDFLSDYDRDARRSMRAWRRHFVLALTEKISFCPEAVYHYRQHEQGNHHQIRKRTADILPMIPRWLSLIEEFYEQRHLWKRKAGHLVRFIEHEPFELRLLGMPFSPPEQEILYSIIRDFLTAHCTAAECRRASLHLPFRLLLQSSGFSDFGRRLRRAGKNTGIRRKLLHFCPVPSWRRNGRAQLRQVREQLEEIRRNITF